jgi:class 3 adenylate cyclase
MAGVGGIAEWLEAIGLEKYAPAFADHEIDLAALPHLTEDDLREIGLPLGPRRKVLAARSRPLPNTSSPAVVSAAPAAERRHLTVMFVDLVGSTNMSVHTDPEVLADILRDYKRAAAAEVSDLGGTIAKFMGDGVLAYFGWPRAREDAAERSLRAAFAIVAAVRRLRDADGRPLQCRIGIATGLVVVGEAMGEGSAREDAVAGETLNLAARLQSLADPDGILIADSTHRMVGRLFSCDCIGEKTIKGFDTPVVAWRVTAEVAHTNRFSAVRASRTPLVGRDHELALLKTRWTEANGGEGRAVLVLGEAGIGKSRLAEALHEQIRTATHSYICWQCSAYHENNALYPVVQYVVAAAGIEDQDAPSIKLEKLATLLRAAGPPPERALPLFADLLSIPASAGYVGVTLPPVQRKAAVIAALSDWIARVAEASPLFLVLEDAHWIDATTQDLMTRLIHGAATVPILILVTARSSFASPWSGRAQVSVLGLNRLSNRQCETLIQEVAANDAGVRALVDQIISKGDGNPLYLEELTMAVLEANKASVPDTLQDSLMARLDQLGSVKLTAQIASVLGRRFASPLLQRVTSLSLESLDADLSQLVAAEVIYPIGRSSDRRFEFKHALMRDAAYNSLLLAHRRQLHERCARFLERDFVEVGEAEPELLALHFAQAGLHAEARSYAERAGDRAVSQYAYVEAISSYRMALEQNALQQTGRARDEAELALQIKLGAALVVIHGPQHSQVRETYLRAQALGTALDSLEDLFKATWGIWYHANIARDFDSAATAADQLIVLSKRSENDGHVLEAFHCRWSSELFSASYADSEADCVRGLAIYDPARHHSLSYLFGGHDPGVCAYCCRGTSKALRGEMETGLRLLDEGLALATQLDHPPSTAHVLMNAALTAMIVRDYSLTADLSRRLAEVAQKYNLPPHIAVGKYLQGWAEAHAGDLPTGIARMEAEFERVTTLGPMRALHAALFGETLALIGRRLDALAVLDRTLASLPFPDRGHYLSEIHRNRAVCLMGENRTDEALVAFTESERLAHLQGAALLRLRTAVSAFPVHTASGRKQDARDHLRTLMQEVSEGHDRPDFTQAGVLL